MGYCLIPSTKGQAALFIVGNGGEGKSRLGVVLNDIFGDSMHSDSFQRIENDRFARYNLRGKLLMYDDDMQMEALKSTEIIKNLITAEIPVDIGAKGKQSQQAQIYCRFFCVGNSFPQALFDKSDGLARRLIILTTKPRSANRRNDPHICDKFHKEKEQIFCWMLDGLQCLIDNDLRFTISDKTQRNVAEAISANNTIIDFLKEGVELKAGAAVGSKRLYMHYCKWCDDNCLTALKGQTFTEWLKSNAAKYFIAYLNNVYETDEFGVQHRVRGFEGIYSDYVVRAQRY